MQRRAHRASEKFVDRKRRARYYVRSMGKRIIFERTLSKNFKRNLKKILFGTEKRKPRETFGHAAESSYIQPWCSMFKRNECRLRYFDTNLRGFDTRQVFLAMVAWNVRWRMKLNITVQFQRRLQHVAWSMLLDWSRGQPCAFQSGFTIPRKKKDEEEEENEGSQLYSIARALRGVWKYNRDVPKAHHELRACVELSWIRNSLVALR